MADILTLGEPLVELNAADDGPLHAATTFTTGFGGDSSNFAVAARRSGADVAYVTHLGDDDFGTALLTLWQREGIRTEYVQREPGGRTGLYFVSREGGSSRFTYYRSGSPASRLVPEDVPASAVASARLLHVSGITQAISTSACDTVLAAVMLARDNGTLVSYDPNHRPALWPLERARAVVMHTVALSDFVFPSLEDGRALTGLDDPYAVLDAFARAGAKTVVLKLGADGALLRHNGETTRIDPHPVVPADPTGAGDTFAGAFTAQLLEGYPAVRAARYAAVAAAVTAAGIGAIEPIPTRGVVEQLLSGRDLTSSVTTQESGL